MSQLVYLSGGVGGARLAEGLAALASPEALSLVINTGDDFVHWGLWICPDLDTVMYTLAGLSHRERGWGLLEESFNALEMARRYGEEDWFALGDRDLATHVLRSAALARGERLTQLTARLASALGVRHRLLPMCDDPRPTRVSTLDGRRLSFQDWLVRERGAAPVAAIASEGALQPTAEVKAALEAADAVIIGPSNPYVSIDPMLGLTGFVSRLAGRRVLAVSPLVGGRAVKGPLAEMVPSLSGEPASAGAIARHYARRLGRPLDVMLVHPGDLPADQSGARRWLELDVLLPTLERRRELAAAVLELAGA